MQQVPQIPKPQKVARLPLPRAGKDLEVLLEKSRSRQNLMQSRKCQLKDGCFWIFQGLSHKLKHLKT